MEAETQNYLVKAVVGLLQEALPYGSGKSREQEETHRRTMQVLSSNNDDDNDDFEDEATLNERRLLSRYGVWLLAGLSSPNEDAVEATFGHMLSMLFQWFNATAYLPNDKTGTALEKLKSEYLPGWLRKVYKSHPHVFVNCLLPNPPDYAKVGGHWDIITCTRTEHIKEGLVRFFCLIPYDVITLEVWNKAMSHWMEAINQEVPKEELIELKNVFCKIFDPDMSPLGFDAREMYQFITERFSKTSAQVQRQALQWLQKLCLLNIHIPMEILFEVLNNGVDTLQVGNNVVEPTNAGPVLIVEVRSACLDPDDIISISDIPILEDEEEEDLVIMEEAKEEIYLTCFNLMLDVLNGQMELQGVEKHGGLSGQTAQDVLNLINRLLATPWLSDVTKVLVESKSGMNVNAENDENDHVVEQLLTDLLQLVHGTLKGVIPLEKFEEEDEDQMHNMQNNTMMNSGSDCGEKDTRNAILKKSAPGLGGFMAVLTTMQSTVEPPREMEESSSESSLDGADEAFEVKLEDYSVPLQLVYHLLTRNAQVCDPDMHYYLLDSVRLLALQCDVLSGVVRKHRKFLKWCQDTVLTNILWQILESAHSQVAQVAVPLLMHAVGLPGGADAFWKLLDEDFNSDDWRTRYAAVEKVTVIFRFLDNDNLFGVNKTKNGKTTTSPAVKSVMSHAFCCIIACMDDITPQVSQQANLYLGTIHDSALKTLVACLEHQFDSVAIDRPIILKRLYQLFNCLTDRRVILTWTFFAARFDLVINEIQNQSSSNNILSRMDSNLPPFQPGSKKNPSTTTTVRSLSASLKYPYKRTVSAPAGMGLSAKLTNTMINISSASSCQRQISAPILKKTGTAREQSLSKQVSNVATVIDELEYVNIAAKTVDLDEVDKETLHLLVFLFMQFLSHPEQAKIPNDQTNNTEGFKSSNSTNKACHKAFGSLYTLLGFNESEKRFTTMPHRIRCTPAINAYFANLPQVLDNNFAMGKHMLLNCTLILQKIPFPPRYATAWQQAYTLMQEKYLFQGCGFSLWHLEPTMRKNWLSSVLVIAYKYICCYTKEEKLLGEKIVGLIRIIIHTLTAQAHVCDRYSKPVMGLTARSRDLSQLSLGEETTENPEENDVFDEQSESESEQEEEKVEVKKNVFGPQEETAKVLPEGWEMQEMRSGNILFINNRNQETTWIDPRNGQGLLVESPPSPLSLMDVITVGSPVNVDRSESESTSSMITSPNQKKLIQEERLLPIGPSRPSNVLDRVWQVLGSLETGTDEGTDVPLIEDKLSVQVVQEETTECYVGHVTHFRNGSFKKPLLLSNDEEVTKLSSNDEIKMEETKKQPLVISNDHEVKKKKKRKRKIGTGSGPDLQQGLDESTSKASSVGGKQQQPRMDSSASLYSSRDNPLLLRQSCLRVGEDAMSERCSRCGMPKEEYTEDEVGHCIVILGTFIHQEPSLVAPLLPEILLTVTRVARETQYSWELDSATYIPSNSRSTAKQFIRCVLHQLSGNGIFSMLFHMELQSEHRQKFFNTIVHCLLDFNELSPAVPVATFLQEMNDKKTLSTEHLEICLPNLACFLSCIPFEQVSVWSNVFPPCEVFFRRLWSMSTGSSAKGAATAGDGSNTVASKGRDLGEETIKLSSQIGALFDIMCAILRMPGVQNYRQVLDPLSKLVSHALQNCSVSFHHLVSVCHLCNKAFTKDRDKLLLTRTAVFELVQALKFKTVMPDANFLMLVNLVLQDAGGCVTEDISCLDHHAGIHGLYNTGACDAMRNHMSDVLDFLSDVHTLSKIKSIVKGMTIGVNEDTLGGVLKASIAQYIALEITKSNGSPCIGTGVAGGGGRDSRTVNRYLPWLYNPPANTAAQGPREFLDCVAHIRLLSWLLLGSVNHTLRFGANESVVSQPIPLEASCHVADHIQVILAGFAEQSKTSVVHMCSLFHAFILCQLWTVYLEQMIALQLAPPPTRGASEEQGSLLAGSILLDFWGKVTPGILQLVSHSKVLAEMVNLHFLSLMEALMECHSTILAKLLPLWTPVLFAFHVQLPDHVRVRLQAIQDAKPGSVGLTSTTEGGGGNSAFLLKWLQRMQFKMGQIEMQASNVTQFFTV